MAISEGIIMLILR